MAKKKTARKMNVYSNLTHKRRVKKDARSRKRAEYMATLPKHPVKRFFYRLHPKRVFGFIFSRRGLIFGLKVFGVAALIGVLSVGALFAYYRQELDQIRPGELAKRVQTTVTKYYDRNGELLWEDMGSGNYKLVVEGDEIAEVMKQATVAIEDRDFYDHAGVSISGVTRAAVNNVRGGHVQGGSTLTQQLVKQVFFADEADERGLAGVPRKIKEMILAIEVERMYNKEQIIELYLNESPFGGRRNGVESAAQTYFNKSARELNLPEAALLAAIPNQPGLYNPYNVDGNQALITRQHRTLDVMVLENYITQEEADEAKAYPIIDSIQPEADQYQNIKAPHFVQMVRGELIRELGETTVGQGGLTVHTTLDLRIQEQAERSMDEMFDSHWPGFAGFTNGAATVMDTQSGEILAMLGSRDFRYPGFGQDNAATAFIQPGSTIKPLVFAGLFQNQGENVPNYGSGSVLADDRSMNSIYGAPLRNADGRFMGGINLRQSLALSRNVPAVKAMHITGVEESRQLIHDLGAQSYCTQGPDVQAGLSSAIGGCTIRMTDLVSGFATLAREGIYKPTSSIKEVKNSQGEVIIQRQDTEERRVVDAQVPYIISDILADDSARAGLYGRNFYGLQVPGVRTAAKTGTSDKDGKAKDIWTVSYSPAITMGVWLGNSDTRTLTNGNSSIPARIVGQVMEYAHKEVYANEGKWNPANGGDWYAQPDGIQRIGGELYPSWYNRNQNRTNDKLTFDRVSKKRATDCTPDAAKIEVDVVRYKDPITDRDAYIVPSEYNANEEDDVHDCNDSQPSISAISMSGSGPSYQIQVQVSSGTHRLSQLEVRVDGTVIDTIQINRSGTHTINYNTSDSGSKRITATIRDEAYYTGSASREFSFSSDDD